MFKIYHNPYSSCQNDLKHKIFCILIIIPFWINNRPRLFILNNVFYFIIPYFFKLDLMYFQCKIICIIIVTINSNAAHSWTEVRKCLIETNMLPLASYPLGNTSQFNKPVMLSKTKRIKDKTLTIQSLNDLLLFIIFHPKINLIIHRFLQFLSA